MTGTNAWDSFDKKARFDSRQGKRWPPRIPGIDAEFPPPAQSGLLTLLHHLLQSDERCQSHGVCGSWLDWNEEASGSCKS